MSRAVFLDRDGVILRSDIRDGHPYAVTSRDEAEILDGVPEAIAALRDAGFLTIIATNQPDVATGRQRREDVEEIHAWLQDHLGLDDIRACYHVDADRCSCRKPAAGMLESAAREWGIDLPRSYMVGDRWRDIESGQAAGCRTILVRAGHQEPKPSTPDAVVDSLLEASALILSGRL